MKTFGVAAVALLSQLGSAISLDTAQQGDDGTWLPEDYIGCWQANNNWYNKEEIRIYADFTYVHPITGDLGEWYWNPSGASLATQDRFNDWHLVRDIEFVQEGVEP